MKRVIEAVLLVLLGVVIGRAAYTLSIVPRLGQWPAVPFHVWALAYLPTAVCAALAAVRPRAFDEAMRAAVVLSLVLPAYGAVVVLLRLPNTAKSLFWESPETYWASAVGFHLPLWTALFLISLATRRGLRLVRR